MGRTTHDVALRLNVSHLWAWFLRALGGVARPAIYVCVGTMCCGGGRVLKVIVVMVVATSAGQQDKVKDLRGTTQFWLAHLNYRCRLRRVSALGKDLSGVCMRKRYLHWRLRAGSGDFTYFGVETPLYFNTNNNLLH